MRAVREAKKRAKAMEVGGTVGVAGAKVCEDELSRRKRKSKKCECKAMIYAGRCSEGGWVIRRVELEHANHSPKPDDAKLVKEYQMKKLTSSVRRKLLKYHDKGVPVSQIHGCLENDSDVEERLRLTVKDLQHEVYKVKKLRMVGGDSAAMMVYFEQMQADNQNFYHAQRLDEMGRLKDVFWVDARSRAAYEEFGDVVCFDATYLTNNYDLPFANFVGVNHTLSC
ncbi:protein FAR1-RELATED SEQUENCE 8-like [Chenopodium quinoa]|uniref:protein FAR1-RELATED SEQUENCE 8-like n=1 Tax=Chenopodium quinoa TaxID=63459 RepID=UPI000B79827C|nr:protein FAR1-RELATED SEQUENCE 8-like [Chenopodium quinoa]